MTAELTTPKTIPAWRRPRITFHPLLFAAYPVLFLWSQNLGETSAADVLPLMAIVVAIAAALTLVLGLVLRDVRRAALVVTPVVAGVLMYGHVETLIEPLGIRTTLQQLAWVALVGIGLVAALRLREPALAAASRILDRVGALLVVIALVVIV
ncbi:MAG TPA: hypothetical protein VFY23_17010, partial [Candidatus Limnocylindrales bacterium]|nr:hypothetical protein [Candidatus Limnocylindrales bacterium]